MCGSGGGKGVRVPLSFLLRKKVKIRVHHAPLSKILDHACPTLSGADTEFEVGGGGQKLVQSRRHQLTSQKNPD